MRFSIGSHPCGIPSPPLSEKSLPNVFRTLFTTFKVLRNPDKLRSVVSLRLTAYALTSRLGVESASPSRAAMGAMRGPVAVRSPF